MAYNKETGMYEGFIYKITNIINGKIYVGQTRRTIEIRWKQHIIDSKNKSTHLYSAIRKYGINNFKIDNIVCISCVELHDLKNKLNQEEIYYIKLYNCTNENYGYNLAEGGHNNVIPDNRKKIDQYDIMGNLLRVWSSIGEITEYYKYPLNYVYNYCTGKSKRIKDYVWRYHGDPFDLYDVVLYKEYKIINSGCFTGKQVVCLSKNYELIKIYDSIVDAGNDVKLKNPYSITLVCQGKRNFAANYRWMYYDDYINTKEVKYA